MSEESVKCGKPAGGPTAAPSPKDVAETVKEVEPMVPLARVGKEAPGFVAPAYQRGKFTQVKLSDFRGHWTMLCFYPGDFTFV